MNRTQTTTRSTKLTLSKITLRTLQGLDDEALQQVAGGCFWRPGAMGAGTIGTSPTGPISGPGGRTPIGPSPRGGSVCGNSQLLPCGPTRIA